MENRSAKNNPWSDYLPMGFAVSVLLSMMDYSGDNFYQIVPVIVFFIYTGFLKNIKILPEFLWRFWYIAVYTAGNLIYYICINRSADSVKFIATQFMVILAGFLFAKRLHGNPTKGYGKLWVMILACILFGIIKMVKEKRDGFFVDPTVELGIAVILMIIALLYIEGYTEKIVSVLAGLVTVYLDVKKDAFHISNVTAIRNILPVFHDGSVKEMLFGRGQYMAQSVLPDLPENTYTALLFDFGLLAIGLYFIVFVFAIVMIITKQSRTQKKQAILVCAVLLLGGVFPMQYWNNSSFLLWTAIGTMLGCSEKKQDKQNKEVI